MEKKRLEFIDYGKALGILFVLLIHSGMKSLNEYVLFAMPLFFIVSGYVLNVQNKTLKLFTKNRFARLIVPFWVISILDILLEIARAYYYRYGNYKIVIPALINLLYGSGFKVPDLFGFREMIVSNIPYEQPSKQFMDVILPTNCHLWFLPSMFVASFIAFAIIKKFQDNKSILFAIMPVLILIAALESPSEVVQMPYCIGRGFIGAAFIIVGYIVKEIAFFEKGKVSTKLVVFAITSAVALYFIKVLGIHGEAMIRSQYGQFGIWSTYLTFLGGIAAAIAVLTLFNILEHVGIGFIGKILSLIGQNTMEIYLYQFLGFFVLEVLFFTVSGESVSPDKHWMSVLPPTANWYKPVGVIVIITTVVFIKKISSRKKSRLN